MIEKIKFYSDLVNHRLKKLTDFGDVPSLYDPITYILQGTGKRIRPILLLAVCEALGGNIHRAIHAATAIEVFHNFTLVHDDIMDGDELRRGRKTIHKCWDSSTAILAGDGMMALAYEELLKSKIEDKNRLILEMTGSVRTVCEGQAMDKDLEEGSNYFQDEYLEMIRRKTAELIRVSAVCGAVIAGAIEGQIKSAGIYAENIGLAFQIMDDLLEIRSNSNQMGKSLGSDLGAEKQTFPLTKLYEKMSSEDFQELLILMRTDDLSIEIRRRKFRKVCTDYNIFEDGNQFFQELTEKSFDAIKGFPEKGKKMLKELAMFIIKREK